MTTGPDFDPIDDEIAALQERLEGCHRAMIVSRVVAVVSLVVVVLVTTIADAWRTPVVVFSAIAGLVGGPVWLGASTTSRDEALASLEALDRTKARMIDDVARRNGWRDMTPTVH